MFGSQQAKGKGSREGRRGEAPEAVGGGGVGPGGRLGGLTPEKFLKSYLKNCAFACISGAENRIGFHQKNLQRKSIFDLKV